MYVVDERDVVVRVAGIPSPSAGAPEPVIVADEGSAVVAYYGSEAMNWDTARPEDFGPQQVVVLRFGSVRSLMFGSPNDEAVSGHPLFGRGLDYYAVHSVEDSSWVRRLERMNSVRPQHNASGFLRLRHFIVTFHDSTFECVCRNAPTVELAHDTTPEHAARAKPTNLPSRPSGGVH